MHPYSTGSQQDAATAQTSNQSLASVREMFPGHFIPLRDDTRWPPRSQDLTPYDLYLTDYLNSKVYQLRPQNY